MSASFTTTISVDQTPEQAFDAVNDVRAWWTGAIEGDSSQLGDEFSYEVPGVHYCMMRVTELVPAEKVAWSVVDSRLDFLEDRAEWTGTTVVFEIFARDGRTQVRFTHVGLVPDYQCYDDCSSAWSFFVNDSLKALIGAGSVPASS